MGSLFYFLFLSGLLAVLVWYLLKSNRLKLHEPVFVFLFFYLMNIGVGASIIGLTNGQVFYRVPEYGIDVRSISHLFGLRYWLIVFFPCFVTILIYPMFKSFIPTALKLPTWWETPLRKIVVIGFVLFLLSYVAVSYQAAGVFDSFRLALRGGVDYETSITLRSEILGTLSQFVFATLYISLPAIGCYALIRSNLLVNGWLFLSAGVFLASSGLTVMSFQKGPLIISVLVFLLTLIRMRKASWKLLLILAALVLFVVTTYQRFVLGNANWSLVDTVLLFILRSSSVVPFYANLYPETIPYFGVNLPFDGRQPTDNLEVFTFMYPQVTWTQGSLSVPSFLRAFSQGGLGYALIDLTLISLGCALIEKLVSVRTAAFYSAVYVLGLLSLFLATQLSIVQFLLSSYGILWGVAVLMAMQLTQKVLNNKFSI